MLYFQCLYQFFSSLMFFFSWHLIEPLGQSWIKWGNQTLQASGIVACRLPVPGYNLRRKFLCSSVSSNSLSLTDGSTQPISSVPWLLGLESLTQSYKVDAYALLSLTSTPTQDQLHGCVIDLLNTKQYH